MLELVLAPVLCWFVLIAQVIGSKECKYQRYACQQYPLNPASKHTNSNNIDHRLHVYRSQTFFRVRGTHFGYGIAEYMWANADCYWILVERWKTATWTSKRLNQSFAAKLLFTFAVECKTRPYMMQEYGLHRFDCQQPTTKLQEFLTLSPLSAHLEAPQHMHDIRPVATI